MSTENDKPTNGDNTSEQPAPGASSIEAGERGDATASAAAATASAEQTATAASPAAEQPAAAAAEPPPPAPPQQAPTQASASAASDDDDEDEPRGGGSGGGDAFDFGAMLDQYEQEQAQYQEGSVVRGTVVGVTERSVVIDFGFKSEGAVPIEEFQEAGELTVKRGDEVEVLIKSMESQEGVPILSRADAVRMRAWDELEKAYRDGVPVKGRIAERVKGGLRVDVDGVAAFLPGSQVDVATHPQPRIPARAGDRGQGHQAQPQALERRPLAQGHPRSGEPGQEGRDAQRPRRGHHRRRSD